MKFLYGEWQWLFFDTLNSEMGFLTPRDRSRLPFLCGLYPQQNTVTEATTGDKKRGLYQKYIQEEMCQIGRCSCDHGVAAAAHYFSRNVAVNVIASNVASSHVSPFFDRPNWEPAKKFLWVPETMKI